MAKFVKYKSKRYTPKQMRNSNTVSIKPQLDSRLDKLFDKIGSPEIKQFVPDDFQLKSIEAIKDNDCIVSAPTGSGKTWIAEKAIEHIIKQNGRAWYTSPLKALSNSKYSEFKAIFGDDKTGIITGDRKENTNAPIIIGTTEILRNQLYDTMYAGKDLNTDLVILDEAHYFGDEERGVVWEEIMIYLPPRINILLLSATINNSQQMASWLGTIRDKKVVVIEETKRPVKLSYLFFNPTGKIMPLLKQDNLDSKILNYLSSKNTPEFFMDNNLPPFGTILQVLRKFNLLPAIAFLTSRSNCNNAIELCKLQEKIPEEKQEKIELIINNFVSDFPHLKNHNQLYHLKNYAVAAHHGGQLPAWKLLIEKVMTSGLLDTVFATSTIAAGVNYPARCVLLLTSDRFNGKNFEPLSALTFHQMTGRAGRRGKDNVGFAITLPSRFMNLKTIATLAGSNSENLNSQLKINFSMLLNLLLSNSPRQIKDLISQSFSIYSQDISEYLLKQMEQSGKNLRKLVTNALCKNSEELIELIEYIKSKKAEINLLTKSLKEQTKDSSKINFLKPGRLFLDSRNRLFCVLKQHFKDNKQGFFASRIQPISKKNRKSIKPKWYKTNKAVTILEDIICLNDYSMQNIIREIRTNPPKIATIKEVDTQSDKETKNEDSVLIHDYIQISRKQISECKCSSCDHYAVCHKNILKNFNSELKNYSYTWHTLNQTKLRLYNKLDRHLSFLIEEGFVSKNHKLTDDGIWASRLRLDYPLLVAECIRENILPYEDPALLGALMSTFASDRIRENIYQHIVFPKQVKSAFYRMENILTPLMQRMKLRGFKTCTLPITPAILTYTWIKSNDWNKVLSLSDSEEGDLVMIFLRTADSLRHIESLSNDYPDLANSASEAIYKLLKPPVLL